MRFLPVGTPFLISKFYILISFMAVLQAAFVSLLKSVSGSDIISPEEHTAERPGGGAPAFIF